MGFLDFLTSRKAQQPPPPPPKAELLQGQAYASTAASAPPTRGSFPVSGNGPKTLAHLQQVAKQRSQSQLSQVSIPVASVPRTSSGSASTRPNTSAGRSKSISRPKSAAGNSLPDYNQPPKSPVTPKSQRKYGPYRIYKDDDAPPTPRIPDEYSRRLTMTPLSDSSRRKSTYVDILDAQSDFKAADFHTRVKAAGARDYGEDVADRNLTAYAPSTTGTAPTTANGSGASWQSQDQGHKFNRVSVIAEDADEGRELEKGSASRKERTRSRDPNPEHLLRRRRSFGETAATRNGNRTKPPRPLSLHSAVLHFAYPSGEMPNKSEMLESRRTSYAPESESEAGWQRDQEEEDLDSRAPPPSVPQTRRREEAPRAKSHSRASSYSKSLHNNNRSHVDFDATDNEPEEDDDSSTAPSPKISKVSRHIAHLAPPDLPQVNSGWTRAHGSTYREFANPQGRPATSYGGGGYYSKRPRSLAPSIRSLQSLQPVPSRSSSLAPWPAPLPESPTTVSSSAHSGHALSPPKSQYTVATSIDERELYPPSQQLSAKAPSHGDASENDRQRDFVSGSSYTTVPERSQRLSAQPSRQSSRRSHRRMGSAGTAITDDLRTATESSDFEAYLARRETKRRQEESMLRRQEEALQWYEENGFAEVGRSLPGLFDGVSTPTISNWPEGRQPTSQPPTSDRLSALLSGHYPNKEPASSASSRKAYTNRLTNALLDHYADDYESEDNMSMSEAGFNDGRQMTSRDRAVQLLSAMKEQGLDIMDLLDMEETLRKREREDAQIALSLRKEMKRLERLQGSRKGLGNRLELGEKLQGKSTQRILSDVERGY